MPGASGIDGADPAAQLNRNSRPHAARMSYLLRVVLPWMIGQAFATYWPPGKIGGL